jgi:hypothetical protein
MSNPFEHFTVPDPPWPSDDKEAARWRGYLKFRVPWPFSEMKPNSVTFPICEGCGRVVWNWPHFEEPVPHGAVCEHCFKDAAESENG